MPETAPRAHVHDGHPKKAFDQKIAPSISIAFPQRTNRIPFFRLVGWPEQIARPAVLMPSVLADEVSMDTDLDSVESNSRLDEQAWDKGGPPG